VGAAGSATRAAECLARTFRPISRSDLYRAFKDDGLVRLFEEILQTLNETLPADTTVVQAAIDAHIADTVDAHEATAIGVTPTGGIASNNVQAALAELDTEKLAASLVTAYGLTLIAAANAGAARTVLALGTIATQNANAVSLTGGTIGLASGTLGYATGNGGTVTQALNKGTGVTLNKITGEITLNAAGLAANTAVTFTLTNSTIAATDRIVSITSPAAPSPPMRWTPNRVQGRRSLVYATSRPAPCRRPS
jgi:hypothetical protein